MQTILYSILSSIKLYLLNFVQLFDQTNYGGFFSPKQGLAKIKVFFKSQCQCTYTIYISYNFNSCSERLCEGIGQNPREDDNCDNTLAMHINY